MKNNTFALYDMVGLSEGKWKVPINEIKIKWDEI